MKHVLTYNLKLVAQQLEKINSTNYIHSTKTKCKLYISKGKIGKQNISTKIYPKNVYRTNKEFRT